MPSIYDLKPRFQALLRPAVLALMGRGVTANQVTLAALALSGIAGLLIVVWPGAFLPLFLLPFVLFARMALNAIDGMMAREHGQASRLGALLNELSDLASDILLYAPFALIPGIWPPLPLGVVFLALLSEAAGILAVTVGATRRYDGPMGKSDRAFVFGLLALLLAFAPEPGWWVTAYLLAIAGLLAMTLHNRIVRALAESQP